MARKGIKVTLSCPADACSDHAVEKIVEFWDWNTGQGGLIQFYSTPERNLRVTVYRHSSRVHLDEGRREHS